MPKQPARSGHKAWIAAWICLGLGGVSAWAHPPKADALETLATVSPKRVKGHVIKAGAQLGKADLREANLRKCCLIGAYLDSADLRDADLRGADLTGADLSFARMKGAKLQGSILHGALIAGATDLDLTGAEVHPFFTQDPDEPVGTVKELMLPWAPGMPRPEHIFQSAAGNWVWTEIGNPSMGYLAPTGRSSVKDWRMEGLRETVLDKQNRLWLFGKDRYVVDDMDACIGRSFGRHFYADTYKQSPVLERLACAVPSPTNGIVVALPDLFLFSRFAQGDHQGWLPLPAPVPSKPGSMAVSDDRRMILTIDPERPGVAVQKLAGPHATWEEATRPGRVVKGSGDCFWITYPEANKLVVFKREDIDSGKNFRELALPGENAGIHGLAPGPDGALWVALKHRRSLLRVVPGEAATQFFPLPAGMIPLEVVGSADGRVYFTLEGKHSIGSLRAVPHPKPAAPETGSAAASFTVSAYEPKAAARKTLSRAERHERLQEALQRHEDLVAGLGPDADNLGEERSLGPEAAEVKEEKKAPPAAPKAAPRPVPAALPAPLERLEDLGVELIPAITDHIHRRHGFGKNARNSQFLEEHTSPEAIERLLAQGLEDAGEIGRVLRSDHQGRVYTQCLAAEPVGRIRRGGEWVLTRAFDVAMRPYRAENGDWVYNVRTAFPVAE